MRRWENSLRSDSPKARGLRYLWDKEAGWSGLGKGVWRKGKGNVISVLFRCMGVTHFFVG